MSDLELLKSHLKELDVKLGQIKAIRDRIEVECWKDTKRLLLVAFTELQTSTLYLKEAIVEQERILAQRYA